MTDEFVYVPSRLMYLRLSDVSAVAWYSDGYEYNRNNVAVKMYFLEVTVANQTVKIMNDKDIDVFMSHMGLSSERPKDGR